MKKKVILISIFILSIVIFPVGINYLKHKQIEQFNQKNFTKIVEQSEIYLQALIKEKRNSTAAIAVGLVNSENIIYALKNPKNNKLDLRSHSIELRDNTDFKNVWFHLVDKNGISIQRSWSEYSGDDISKARIDIQKMIKNPKIMNTISVGKFDMTFKSMVPIFDEDKNFLGMIEVITHFNSITNKLKDNNINSIFLVDKRYKEQITKPFTKLFIGDFYVATFDFDNHIKKYIQDSGAEKYLSQFVNTPYIVDNHLNTIVSYHILKDINGDIMAHILLSNHLKDIDILKVEEITYIYNLYIFLSILILVLLFYFLIIVDLRVKNDTSKNKLLVTMIIVFIVAVAMIYKFNNNKYANDIKLYKNSVKSQTLLEYNAIMEKNKQISEVIFSSIINKPDIIKLFKDGKRKELHDTLVLDYENMKLKYNIRQLHFHDKNSVSFLRMHRPSKYGDSLKGIRQSVDFVNQNLKIFSGFEEGRIFNGFRNVFPLFDENNLHIGSVEVSFDIYSFMDNYFNVFDARRVNFLLNGNIIDKKVFEDEKSNYIKSPIEGFYFDKIVLAKLKNLNKDILPQKKDKEKFEFISQNILYGDTFVVEFPRVDELVVIIPLINSISGEVAGSINISKSNSYISQRKVEFYQFIIVVSIILLFLFIFIYREIVSKINIRFEFQKNQKILDSQNSFIIITNGYNISVSNRTMSEFFGFDTLENFKLKHSCICDYFESDESNEFVQKQMGTYSWLEYIKIHNSDNLKVKMSNKNNEAHIFKVELVKFEKDEYIISFLDITQIEKANKELNLKTKEQNQLLELFNKGEITLFKWKNDESWSVEYVSSNCQKITGYTKEQFLNKEISYSDIINKDDLKNVSEELESALNNQMDFFTHKPYKITTKDNLVRYILDSTLIIKDNNQNVTHLLGYLIDITQLKNMESQLIQSEKMVSLGNMIGNIAHQWRQPLSIISTSASGVQLKSEFDTLTSEELDEYMNVIIKHTKYLSDTIDTFRNFIKEEKTIRDIEIQEDLNNILKILNSTLANNHIKLINKIDYEKPIIKKMPSGELAQVISNLVNNAKDVLIERNISNPIIEIGCKIVNDKIVITVTDNAGGVPKSIVDKIFEPYFTTKHQSQGTGLGLYMSHKIVTESLHGELIVVNTDDGAMFKIEL